MPSTSSTTTIISGSTSAPFAELPVSVSVAMPHGRTAAYNAGRALSIRRSTPATARSTPIPTPLIVSVAQRYQIDPHLLAQIVKAESGGRQTAISRKGALGLMQVMPATARALGVRNPNDLLANPTLALEVGATYLKTLQARLGNNVPLVLAAYNAGPGAVVKAGMKVPRYAETQAYVGRIMSGYVAARATTLR